MVQVPFTAMVSPLTTRLLAAATEAVPPQAAGVMATVAPAALVNPAG